VYGNPGTSYEIQTRTELNPAVNWRTEGRLTLPGLVETFTLQPNTNRVNFYRAAQSQ
jgi:hypothetical protein